MVGNHMLALFHLLWLSLLGQFEPKIHEETNTVAEKVAAVTTGPFQLDL